MVDINVNSDVKAYGLPVAPAGVEIEDRSRPQVQPVGEDTGASGATMDNRALQRKAEENRVKTLSVEDLSKAVADIQQRLDAIGGNLAIGFSMDEPSKSIIVRVTERKSGEVVKQFPPEEVLKLRAKLEDVIGLLFDKKV